MQIYMDHAATTKLSDSALNAMLPYMNELYGNPSSLHDSGAVAARAVYSARISMAALLGCSPRELYFTATGSESDNQALLSAAAWGKNQKKQHIITSSFEHPAVLRTLEHLETQGFSVTRLPIAANGTLLSSQVEGAFREDTALVSIMAVNNEIGTIQPLTEIGALCRSRGILFHTDAVQAAGNLPLSVQEMNIDLLSISAHKFHGPKGAALLYIRNGIAPVSLIHGGGQERGSRAGTENVPAIVGMAKAFEEAISQMQEATAYLATLKSALASGLKEIPNTFFIGASSHCVPGILNVCFEGIENETLLLLLAKEGICISAGSACSSGALEPSHVLRAIRLPEYLLKTSVRFSLGRENTLDQVATVAHCVKTTVEKLRKESL